MEIGDLVYVLIGVVWLIYSFLKKGNKKTTSDLSGDEMTEQPVEEYLPSDLPHTEGREVAEQVENPYETVRKDIRERERAEEKLEVALSSTSPSPALNALKGLPQKPPKPIRTEKPTLTLSMQKKGEILPARHSVLAGRRAVSSHPFREEQGEDLPDFDLRKAVVFYEILKRPEY